IGLRRAWADRHTPAGFLALAGFFTAPAAALLVVEANAIDRELGLIPFAVLLAVYGLDTLRRSDARVWRAAVPVLLAAMALQFTFFYREYMNGYRVSAPAAFHYNVRGVAEAVLARATPGRTILFSRSIPYARQYWRFALAKAGRESLDQQARVFDPSTSDIAQLPEGSLVAADVDDAAVKAASARSILRLLIAIGEPGSIGSVYQVYERQ